LHKKYPLQIAISTLFISLTVILGAILSWHSYDKTSEIMLSDANDIYRGISQELYLDFKSTYGVVGGGLRQLRLSPVINAKDFNERSSQLPGFKAVLKSEASVFAVGVGYPDGDYLGLSRADSDFIKQKYDLPPEVAYVAFYMKQQMAEASFDPGKMYLIYYDENLNEVSRSKGAASNFDPRTRPWYKQAEAEPRATSPYLFYESEVVGLTAMSKTAVPGVIVVFDITLKSLSETISRYEVTESSEVVLINTLGQTFAYKDLERVVIDSMDMSGDDDTELQLANLGQLGSGVLSYLHEKFQTGELEAIEQALDFEFDGRHWIGSKKVVARPGGVDLFALIVSPVDELLEEAVEIRWAMNAIALLVLLLFIPLIWYTSKKISTPLNLLSKEAEAIARFDFDETHMKPSFIKEVHELDNAMEMMKSTINKFIDLINSLAGEQNLDTLLKNITRETMMISHSDAALIYLVDEQDDRLKADYLCDKNQHTLSVDGLSALSLQDSQKLLAGDSTSKVKSNVLRLESGKQGKLDALLEILDVDKLTTIVMPLQNRNDEIIGLLCLIYIDGTSLNHSSDDDISADSRSIDFVEALSGFAAVTLESRQLFKMQEALLHSFIKLIAGAIDAKSPYTGGHCQRVPEITLMLAKAACESDEEPFKGFNLDEKQWEELGIAGWLHDCGKVTTPEYVVDKATKLETIYDRIHEIRMRFEVLKRDAEIACWQAIAEGGDKAALMKQLAEACRQLDDDFAFIAECNVGGEFMADDRIERLQSIAERTWKRTLDNNLGLSWEELSRKEDKDESLPVEEKLLSDKPEHLIVRHENDRIPDENPWGFNVDTPEHKYNRGELYNLSVKKGTLSEEERYMINGHMIQTIIMLNNLPYPKYLRDVPLIAGSHHETMDGQGYPKKLNMSEQPLTARMMVIADIFEALTASDRPYKKAKTLSESIKILSFMRNDKHIDPDLFRLFLTSGVYKEYAEKFLEPEQIDEVNVEGYL